MGLASKKCTPCRGGIPPLSTEESVSLLEKVPDWYLIYRETRIARDFKFKNFTTALKFVNNIASLAEDEGHHPDITFGWGYCRVTFYTHKIGGLHENDFIMAARVNSLYEEPGG